MSEHLTTPLTHAATTVVTFSKIVTPTSAAIAGTAGYFGDNFFAWAGLLCTILFGSMGLAVTLYFKWQDYKLKKHSEFRERERHRMLTLEHDATMKRLTTGRID